MSNFFVWFRKKEGEAPVVFSDGAGVVRIDTTTGELLFEAADRSGVMPRTDALLLAAKILEFHNQQVRLCSIKECREPAVIDDINLQADRCPKHLRG